MTDVNIQAMKRKPSTTKPEERNRCPECRSVSISPLTRKNQGQQASGKHNWRCNNCQNKFNDPITLVTER